MKLELSYDTRWQQQVVILVDSHSWISQSEWETVGSEFLLFKNRCVSFWFFGVFFCCCPGEVHARIKAWTLGSKHCVEIHMSSIKYQVKHGQSASSKRKIFLAMPVAMSSCAIGMSFVGLSSD